MNALDKKVEVKIQIKRGSIAGLIAISMLLSWHSVFAQAQSPLLTIIPDTPAGSRFAAWLAAFNSGKRETMRRFIEEHFDQPPGGALPADEMAARDAATLRETGGFLVRKIVSSTPATLTALIETQLTGYWMKIQFSIKTKLPDDTPVTPYKVIGIGFSNIAAPTELLPKTRLSIDQIRLKIADLMEKLIRVDRFSGAILIARNEKILYQRVSGLADRAWQIRNRSDTKFNLASMTKMFTAVAVAQLVEKGKITLDEPVGKVLPDYPNREVSEKVTVRQLLNHTSGLAGADRTAEKLLATFRQGARTISEHLSAFAGDPLNFEPGSRFEYSNYGYILLGAIIEKISGQDYYSYVRENIFQAAEMMNTDFYELDTDPPNLAKGLMDAPSGGRRSNTLFIGVKGMPAGGAYSTLGDLLKFSIALKNQKLLGSKSLELLWTGSKQNARYGGGFEINRYNKTRIVGHGGGWFGVTNRMEIYPDLGYTVVILSNYDSDPTSITNKLREWLTQNQLNEMPDPPEFSLTVKLRTESVESGSRVQIIVEVKNTGGEAEEKIIDLEIKDASGAKIEQQFTSGQSFTAGETKTYTYFWTPIKLGIYAIEAGVFGDNWATKHFFKTGAAIVTVK